MTAPKHIVDRYLRGGCLAFAIAARRELGMQLHVLIDSHDGTDDWVHVFVADLDRGIALDVRGEMELDPKTIGAGADVSGRLSFQRTTAKEAARRIAGWPTSSEISEARRVVVEHIKPMLASGAVVPASFR